MSVTGICVIITFICLIGAIHCNTQLMDGDIPTVIFSICGIISGIIGIIMG